MLVAVHIACSACRSYGCRGCPRAFDSQRFSQWTANIPGPGRPALREHSLCLHSGSWIPEASPQQLQSTPPHAHPTPAPGHCTAQQQHTWKSLDTYGREGLALHMQTDGTSVHPQHRPQRLRSNTPVHHEWLTGSFSYRKWLSTVSFLASLGSPVMNRVCLTCRGPYQEENHRDKSRDDGGRAGVSSFTSQEGKPCR